jgi:protein TonB
MKNLETLDDMLFATKNKDYGAYELRLNYANSLNKAFIIGTSLFVGIALSSFTYYKTKKVLAPLNEDKTITIILPPKEKDKPIEIKKIEPLEIKKELVKTVIFIVPTPVIDTKDITEITVPELDKLENSVIGKENIDEGKDGYLNLDMVEPPKQVEIKQVDLKPDDTPVSFVEQQPEFVGGMKAMYEFLGKNLKYPKSASNSGIEGKVFLKFIVEKDGSVTDIKVLRGIGFGCDEAAIHAVKQMPSWNPGKQNGQAVRVYFTIPINFQLDN